MRFRLRSERQGSTSAAPGAPAASQPTPREMSCPPRQSRSASLRYDGNPCPPRGRLADSAATTSVGLTGSPVRSRRDWGSRHRQRRGLQGRAAGNRATGRDRRRRSQTSGANSRRWLRRWLRRRPGRLPNLPGCFAAAGQTRNQQEQSQNQGSLPEEHAGASMWSFAFSTFPFYAGIPGFRLVAGVSQFSPDADNPIRERKRYKRASPPAKPRLGGQPAAQDPHTPRRWAFGQPPRSTTGPGPGTVRWTLQYEPSLEEGSPPSSTRPMRTAQSTS